LEKRFTRVRVKFIRGDQIISNGRCRFAEHIGDNCIKSNIADGKGVLETVLFAALAAGQLKTVTGVFTEDTDILTGDKAAGDKAEAEKVANPFGILGIIFVAFYGSDPLGVSNGDIDFIFQKIKDRNPILSGRFHADIKTGILKKPLFEMSDVTVESREAFFVVRRLDAFVGFDDCGNEKGFMDIDATTGRVNNFHGKQLLS